MNPYLFALYAWSESTTMQVTFKKVAKNSSADQMMVLRGELRISTTELLKSLISLEGNRKGKFVCLLLQNLFRTYITGVPRGYHKDFLLSDLYQRHYPESTLHDLKTGIHKLKSGDQDFENSNRLTTAMTHSTYSDNFMNLEKKYGGTKSIWNESL